jgi:Outer membrane protein beta-barrel domain
MNREFAILSISLASVLSNVHAQPLSEWGFKAGITISNQRWDFSAPEIDRDLDKHVGLNLAIFGRITELNFLSIVGEFSYVQKGATEEMTPTFVDTASHGYIELDPIRFRNRFDYVSLSLYGKFGHSLWRFEPYIFVGPRIDFLLKARSETIPKSIYKNFDNPNLDISLGLGTAININLPFKILIEFQYDPGVTNSYKNAYLSIKEYSYEIKLGAIF